MGPVNKINLDLVLAAKSTNMFSDQEIMRWIKKVKKVEPEIALEWKKMGRLLSVIFIEQFKKIKRLSYYLQNEVDPTDIVTWKTLLNTEYIWPIGADKVWGNVFSDIPIICHKIDKLDAEQTNTASTDIKSKDNQINKPKEEA